MLPAINRLLHLHLQHHSQNLDYFPLLLFLPLSSKNNCLDKSIDGPSSNGGSPIPNLLEQSRGWPSITPNPELVLVNKFPFLLFLSGTAGTTTIKLDRPANYASVGTDSASLSPIWTRFLQLRPRLQVQPPWIAALSELRGTTMPSWLVQIPPSWLTPQALALPSVAVP